MTSEENELRDVSLKPLAKPLKVVGKSLATIVSPPVGGFLWPKHFANRCWSAFGGVIASLALSLSFALHQTEIYDSPRVYRTKYPAINREYMFGALLSPLYFHAKSKNVTSIQVPEEDKPWVHVWDKDAIQFEKGRYTLNLNVESRVGPFYKSVAEDEKNVRDIKARMVCDLAHGDIFQARETKAELLEARQKLRKTRELYDNTRKVFEGAVGSMNSELGDLIKILPEKID